MEEKINPKPARNSRPIIQDVVSTGPIEAKSSMLDSKDTTPNFLKRKQEFADDYSVPGPRERRSMTVWIVIGVGIVLAIVLFFFLSNMFALATVNVESRREVVTLDDTLTARTDAQAGSLQVSELSVEETTETSVQSSGTKSVERKASGRITIYNNEDEKPFKLIGGTRFQSPNGMIYKIQNAVTIPGKRTQNGAVIPGQLEATVFAAEPGEAFNQSDMVEFTVPGLKDTPQFGTIYAKSKTSMEGGYKGEVYVISDADRSASRAKLEASLKALLLDKLSTEAGTESVIVSGTEVYEFGELIEPKAQGSEAGSVSISLKGRLLAHVADGKALASFLASTEVPDYAGEKVRFQSLEGLALSASTTQGSDGIISVKATGSGTLVWVYDAEELKKGLAGIKKAGYSQVLDSFPAVESAKVQFRPPWLRSFPEDVSRIRIIEESTGSNE